MKATLPDGSVKEMDVLAGAHGFRATALELTHHDLATLAKIPDPQTLFAVIQQLNARVNRRVST
jgi:hypothetical protein